MALQVTQSQDNGYQVYKFTNRGTEYEVLVDVDSVCQVWSNRIGFGGFIRTAPTIYDTLEDMAKRSKTFNNLVTLIKG